MQGNLPKPPPWNWPSIPDPHTIPDSKIRDILLRVRDWIEGAKRNWPKGDGSVLSRGNMLTLENDANFPGPNKMYATNKNGLKGWVPVGTIGGNVVSGGGGGGGTRVETDHPFKFTKTSDTGGTITTGLLTIDGVDATITGLPTSLSGVSASIKYWLDVDLTGSTATWESGTDFPEGDDTTEIVPILEITCAGGIISSWIQHEWSDVRIRTVGSSVDVDTLVTGDKFAEVEYSTSTHVLRYRAALLTVTDGKLTKVGPLSDWVTIDTAVAES
jgi:hypothetical protein